MLSTAHIQDEDLNHYMRENLDSARTAEIRAHILDCTQCEQKLIGQVVDRLAELKHRPPTLKSREQRVPANGPASLQSLCPLSFDHHDVEVVDSSKQGYGLRTAVYLQPGTIVDLRFGTSNVVGTVRYCQTVSDHEFKAGVQLQTSTTAKGPVDARARRA